MITEITDLNFDEFVKQNELVMIQLTAIWCGPCKVLSPIVEQLSLEFMNENKLIKIGKMNVDETRDKAVELGITSIPTILVYKDGELVNRHTGMIQKIKLRQMIENYL